MAVITISRQFGAGGKTLGKRLAEKLGYTLVDDQIIDLVAEKAKVSRNWVESIEEEAGGTLLKFLSGLVSKSFVDRILDDSKGYIDETVYVDTLGEVIRQLAKEDNCIILGRGGQFLLRGEENVLHLLLVAEKEDRIRFMEENYDLLPTQAKNVVTVRDKRRRTLFRRFGEEDYNHPALYNLVLNMSRLPMEKAVEIVSRLLPA